MITVPN